MNRNYLWIAAIIVVVLILWVLSGTKKPAPTAPQVTPQAPTPVAVSLNELNKSGQSGTAMIKEVEGKAEVVVTLNGQPKDTEEPAHIHLGSCAKPGDVKFPLNPVKNGSSDTVLDVPMSEIMNNLPLAINVHKSEKELNVYVACGDIVKPVEAPASPSVPTENK